MSIVSCSSCGMQYNAAGYKPGVQFKCTQCGAMVMIAGGAARGPMRPGVQRRTGTVAQQGPGANPYAPPAPRKNVGLMVGLGLGVAVAIGLIVIVVVSTSGPDPREAAEKAAAEKREEERRKQQADDEKKRQKNTAMKTTYDGALAMGSRIESLLRESDKPGIEALFDWPTYASYNAGLAAKDKKYLTTPMFSTGKYEWVKDEAGKELLKWQIDSVHTADSLRKQVMEYLERHCFGSPEIIWDRASTDKPTGEFGGVVAGGRTYMGKKIYFKIKGAGQAKEFWVGAPEGDGNVRVINFIDPSATKNMIDLVVATERRAAAEGGPGDSRGLEGGFEERRNRVGGSDAPPKPEGPPGSDTDIPKVDEEIVLPALARTGVKPSEPRLENILRSLNDGKRLALAQKNTILSSPIADRKQLLGAMIDSLIDAQKGGKRLEKATLSAALLEIWGNFARKHGWTDEEVTYNADATKQSDSEDPIRRWLYVYNEYSK